MIRKIRRWRESRAARELFFVAPDLNSIDSDLCFQMEFHVSWTFLGGMQHHYSPEAVIRSFVRDRAQRICRHESISNFQSVEDEINSLLGGVRLLAQGNVRMLWGHGRMNISPELVVHAHERKINRLKTLELEKEQEDQFRRVSTFRERILEDPGMALTYWFMENPENLSSQALSDIERLVDKLVVHNADSAWVLIAKIVHEFIGGLSAEEKRDSIEVLMIIFKRYERHEMVERLRSDLGRLTSGEEHVR